MRLVVIGVSGSGKTTLARQIAQTLDLPQVELDTLYWEANWQAASRPVFRGRVQKATAGDAWVVDGNYSQGRDIVWSRTTHLAWLDYGLATVMGRVLWRTACRLLSQQELWNGNRERFRTSFFSRESVILWALTTYRRRRRQIPQQLALPEHSHLAVVHLRSPRETRSWLEALAAIV